MISKDRHAIDRPQTPFRRRGDRMIRLFLLTIALLNASAVAAQPPRHRLAIHLVPLTESEISILLIGGCLDQDYYSTDSGTLCFFPNGYFRNYGGYGGYDGQYVITNNEITITIRHDPKVVDLHPEYFLFERDRLGSVYYRKYVDKSHINISSDFHQILIMGGRKCRVRYKRCDVQPNILRERMPPKGSPPNEPDRALPAQAAETKRL